MKKQTALESLLQKIEEKNGKEFSSFYSEFIDEAKQKEKEQIENASRIGYMSGMEKQTFDDSIIKAFSEKYYKITFNK